jgi:hypothetical protein
VVKAVKNDTHTLPGGDQGRNTEDEKNDGEYTPSTSNMTECDDDECDDGSDDEEDTETASKDDTGTVAIADGPSNEVGMSLTAKRVLDGIDDLTESGGMGRVLKSLEKLVSLTTREIELAWRALSNVDRDDA